MDVPDPLLPLWAMELMASVFLYAWLFCLGATVGSFLNVVVYRLPRRLNLAYPGSFCPRCGNPIRLADNIPIVSWLLLRGRCRDCGGMISARYFLVELAVAIAFLLVLAAEHYLPPGLIAYSTRPLLTSRDGIPFWCMYATHVGLVTTLLGAVLILGDGFDLPGALFLPIVAVGFFLPLIFPDVRSVPAFAYRDSHVWLAGLIDGVAGLAAGLVVGLVGSLWRPRSRGQWPSFAPVSWSCAVGVVLGWQRTTCWLPVILLVCLLTAGVLRAFFRPSDGEGPSAEPIDTSRRADGDLSTLPEASSDPDAVRSDRPLMPSQENLNPP